MNWKRFGREIGAYVIATVVIVGMLWTLNKLFVGEVPAGNKDALMMIIGALVGQFVTIVGFYFGSSKGSDDKNELLAAKKPEA